MKVKIYYAVSVIAVASSLLTMAFSAHAQDPHFAAIEPVNIWYNPALKTNKLPRARLNFRSVHYPGIVSYSSKAATIEIPLISREETTADNIFFAHVAAGIMTDNSTDRFMNASTAMMAFSYALPLNDDNTYLSLGFQGNYSFNRFGTGGSLHFPDGFDRLGAFASAMANDPYQSGYSFGYFTAGAGVAVFHDGNQHQWYIGTSVRHFNKPYTNWNRDERLAAVSGIQAGIHTLITDQSAVGAYCNLNWQRNIDEQLIGVHYTRNLDDSINNSISVGLGYRLGDALVPNLGIKFGNSRVNFYYEINASRYDANDHRRAWEFCYQLNL